MTQKENAVAMGGQRDFDFEIGRWKTRLKRLLKPLSGAAVFADYNVKMSVFPTSLNDATKNPRLVQGYAPDSLNFTPDEWHRIR